VAQDYVTINVTDYRDMLRAINKIEPTLARAVKRNIKDIAERPRKAIRSAIPSTAPIRGMKRKLSPVGKTWNNRGASRTVTIKQYNMPQTRKIGDTRVLSMVKLKISSPATIIADMAGRGNVRLKGLTAWYTYPLAKAGVRRHTVTSQGYYMIDALSKLGRGNEPSRMVYPAAESVMPQVADEFAALINYVVGEIERG